MPSVWSRIPAEAQAGTIPPHSKAFLSQVTLILLQSGPADLCRSLVLDSVFPALGHTLGRTGPGQSFPDSWPIPHLAADPPSFSRPPVPVEDLPAPDDTAVLHDTLLP